MTKRVTSTKLIELAETHNFVLSLQRLRSGLHDDYRWRRAFYHALGITLHDRDLIEKIRQVLNLP